MLDARIRLFMVEFVEMATRGSWLTEYQAKGFSVLGGE
jgi:hypothetical protein